LVETEQAVAEIWMVSPLPPPPDNQADEAERGEARLRDFKDWARTIYIAAGLLPD